jgi:signal transduction histidine kinase
VSWFICRGNTVCDQEGRPLHLTGIFIDVTARKVAEAEAELQRTELNHIIRVAALGELSNGLARELSQPLTAIVANAAAAQSIAKQDRQEVAQVLKEIVEDSERAGQVVHRLRTLLKRDERQSEDVDLNGVVLSTLSLLRAQLVSLRIKPQTDLAKNAPEVLGNRAQLQQVFVSLMTNALEAMESTPPAARKLVVRTRFRAGRIPGDRDFGLGERTGAARKPEPFPPLLHDQGAWAWPGAVDLLDDCRFAWRPSEGDQHTRRGRDGDRFTPGGRRAG